jgi:type IV pilus assembly protein PilA
VKSLFQAHRRPRDDDGFTLIELMVVVLIISILIAIAIPTFIGARQRAQDRAVQSDLRNGLTAEKVAYTGTATPAYDATSANMKAIEPNLGWGAKLTVVVGNSSVGVADMVCLSEVSKSGTTFSLADIAAGPSLGRYYGKVACPAATEANFSGLGTTW